MFEEIFVCREKYDEECKKYKENFLACLIKKTINKNHSLF